MTKKSLISSVRTNTDQTRLPLRLPQAVIKALPQAHSTRGAAQRWRISPSRDGEGSPPRVPVCCQPPAARRERRGLPSQGINATAGGGSFVALFVWFLKEPRLLVPHALAVACRFGPESPFHPKSLSKGELSELVSKLTVMHK